MKLPYYTLDEAEKILSCEKYELIRRGAIGNIALYIGHDNGSSNLPNEIDEPVRIYATQESEDSPVIRHRVERDSALTVEEAVYFANRGTPVFLNNFICLYESDLRKYEDNKDHAIRSGYLYADYLGIGEYTRHEYILPQETPLRELTIYLMHQDLERLLEEQSRSNKQASNHCSVGGEIENSSCNSTGPWPWGDYETALLRVLADTVKEFCQNETGYPKKESGEVTQWIEECMKKRNLEFSKSMAERIETIISPRPYVHHRQKKQKG